MANGFSTELVVKRKAHEGWFVYTCDELPGLFVASQNDRTAFDDLPASIQKLVKLDHGVDCVVTHKLPYSDLIARWDWQLSMDDLGQIERLMFQYGIGYDKAMTPEDVAGFLSEALRYLENREGCPFAASQ